MLKRKIYGIGLGTIALLAALSGCGRSQNGGSSSSSADTASDSATEKAAENTEKSTISEKGGKNITSDKTEEDTTGVDDMAVTDDTVTFIYETILGQCCNVILAGEDAWGTMELESGSNWIYDIMPGNDSYSALSEVGYLIEDVSGDGVPELLLGTVTEQDAYNDYGSFIYSCYTIKDGAPVCALEGWYRNSYRMMKNGQFFNEGSGGAMYSIFGVYDISQDGTELICQDYYFTSEKNGNYDDIGMFHNTSGVGDVSASEEMDVTMDDFYGIEEDYRQQTYNLTYTPLIEYAQAKGMVTAEQIREYEAGKTDSGINENTDSAIVQVFWLDNSMFGYSDYAEYNVGQMGDQALTIFTTDEPITDFKILSLSFQDITENGELIFDETVVYELAELSPDYPLVAGLDYIGTIPNNGISYVDCNGQYRRFTVEESGMDGSLFLLEY